MFFSDWRVLRRRWHAVLVGVLATVGLGFVATLLVPVTYQATASVLLLPPQNVVGAKGNPYLSLGGLDTVGEIVSRTMTDPTTHEKLAQTAQIGDYTVVMDASTGAPVLLVTADNADAEDALASLRAVVAEVPRALESLQLSEGVISSALIRTTVISQDETAAAQRKAQLRAMIVVLAGGLGLTWLSVALLDSLLMRRRLRPAERAGNEQSGAEAPIIAPLEATPAGASRADQPAADRDLPGREGVPPFDHPAPAATGQAPSASAVVPPAASGRPAAAATTAVTASIQPGKPTSLPNFDDVMLARQAPRVHKGVSSTIRHEADQPDQRDAVR